MSDLTVGTVVDRTLNTWLLGTYSSQFNQLSAGASASDIELSCAIGLGEISAGGYIAIDDELCYIVDRDTTNQRIAVVRGVRGTTAATHLVDSVVEINPRFPRYMVRTAMAEELDSWPDVLYVPKQIDADVTSGTGTITIDPTTDDGDFEVFNVLTMRRASLAFGDDRNRRTDGYEVQPNLIDGGFTVALEVSINTATTFRATVACRFRADRIIDFGDDCDLVDDVGLAHGMVEILELGAAYRLLMARGSVRLFPEAQGQSRIAQEVGSRDIPAFAASLLRLKELAEAREVERLYKRFGFGGQ